MFAYYFAKSETTMYSRIIIREAIVFGQDSDKKRLILKLKNNKMKLAG